MAAEGGHAEAAELLVRARASVGGATNTAETPLHLAAREGHAAAAKLLVARGADVAARTRSGATPLDLATRHRSHEWEALAAFLGRASLAEGAQSKGARLLAIRELVM
jgi:ankyrin repeat protein